MMQKRLKLAKKILNPDTGVLIVTIDEHEVHHLRTLLSELFPEAHIQMVTDVINYKGVSQGHFARVEEYIIYVFMPLAKNSSWYDRMLGENNAFSKKVTWASLLRRGSDSYRQDSPNLYYPILIDEKTNRVVRAGEVLPLGKHPNYDETIDGYRVAWPVRTDLSEGRWSMSNDSLNKMIKLGYVSVGKYDPKRKTWPIRYLFKKQREQIERGEMVITGRDKVTGVVEVEYAQQTNQLVRTVWHRNSHNAGTYGTDLITNILNKPNTFSFPKSLYAVHDALGVVIKDNPNALIVDFFAGSGTTLHAVNLLNAEDNGRRRCILVTNNEVSIEEARILQNKGYQPGDYEWEKHGICQSVTWPRTKYSILGKRDDGTILTGEYLTTLTETKEINRNFYHLSFIEDPKDLNITAKKRILSILKDKNGNSQLPQSMVKTDTHFIISEKHTATILFDIDYVDEWIDNLVNQEHITDIYIIVKEPSKFKTIKEDLMTLLGPLEIEMPYKLPMSKGFNANVEYYKLNFLDKNSVSLGQQFNEILPLLWLMSGAISKRPIIDSTDEPDMLILPDNKLAILVDETKYANFIKQISYHKEIKTIYFVTNSDDAFREMSASIKSKNTFQLYRDYIDNFTIGSRRDF